MSEKRNVPKLRFPEFHETWNTSVLGELGELKNGVNKSKNDFGSGFPFVNLLDVFGKDVIKNYQTLGLVNVSKQELKNFSLSAGDVLFIRSSVKKEGVGETILIEEDLKETVYSGFLIRFRDKGMFANSFKKYCFWTKSFRKKVIQSSTSSANTNINQDSLNDLELAFPSINEQQKIASFLTSVDRRIELLQLKKEKIERYKKGVMQQLFTRKIRFKADDGSEYPDWEDKKLGEVYEFRTTNSFSRDKLNYDSGEYRNIHYGDIHTKFPTVVDLEEIELPYINEDVEIRKTFSDNSVQAGDLIIADASEDYADIGKTIEIVNTAGQKVLAGLHTLHARRRDANVEIGFGGYLMKSEPLRTQVKRIAQGTKVLSISVPRMSELDLRIPCVEEQKKIVQFLRNLDQNSEKLSQQINQSQTWKKGLLQQMFV